MWNDLYKTLHGSEDGVVFMMWAKLAELFFDVEATDNQKQAICKIIKDAKKKGKRLDLSDFEELQNNIDSVMSES